MKNIFTLLLLSLTVCQFSFAQDTPEIFTKYQWLSNIITLADCSDSSVDEYDLNGNKFIFVRQGQEFTLYDANGAKYCADSPSLSCLDTYGLTNLIDSWFCISEDTNVFASICVGDPLPDLRAPFPLGSFEGGACGPQGPIGSPPVVCPCRTIFSIEVQSSDGLISEFIRDQFFTVNPQRTTTYTLTSTSGGAPDLPCIPESFSTSYTIVVKPDSECNTDSSCVCADILEPVCGVNGVTYENRCLADCAGVDIIAEGKCETDNSLPSFFDDYPFLSNKIDPNDCDGSRVQVFDNGAFAFIYIIQNGIGQLYLNGQLHCSDTEAFSCLSLYRLASPTHEWSCGDSNNCACPRILDPVCGADGITYSNACLADCAGVDIISEGECMADCFCTEEYDPVCGADGQTYSNRCFASCAGVDIISEGECTTDCICTAEYAPVCGVDGITYSNACVAGCKGVEIASDGECDVSCACDDVYDPVCGADGKTYSNACSADCAGVDILHSGECSMSTRCNQESGTIFFENCDDGTVFYFIRTDNGTIVDPYFADDINYTPEAGQYIEYDYFLADFDSPCSIAERAIVIECFQYFDSAPVDCFNHFGEIVIRDCDDGRAFVFIESDGMLYDLYFADGISFEYEDGMPVRFDFVTADFDSPCSIADLAISVTCIEQDIPDDSLLGLGELVKSLVDPESCSSTSIQVFEGERTELVYILSNGRGQLYDTDGTFFCADGGAISCLSSYGLETPILTLTCEDLGIVDTPNVTAFETYPWLNNIINQQECENSSVDVYNTGAFAYLMVQQGDQRVLYFEDGQLFCTDSENYSCLAAYQLGSPTSTWVCSDAHGEGEGTDAGGSTANIEVRTCPGVSFFAEIPRVGLFGDNSSVDPGCPPPGLPCSCSLIGQVSVSPEIGVLQFVPEEGILELNPEGQTSYTITIETIASNPESACTPDRFEMVYTIIPDVSLCDGLVVTEGNKRSSQNSDFSKLSINPNPATDIISISGFPSSEATISVYNLVGQQLKQVSVNAATLDIDVSRFDSGLYVLVWQSEEENKSLKFVVE